MTAILYPVLTRGCFRTELFVRRLLMPLQVRRADLSEILARIEPKARYYCGLDSTYILRRIRKALRRPFLMRDRRCLREGLLAYRFLRKAGYQPYLVFGVDAADLHGPRPSAHCWIELGGTNVFNPPDKAMTIVLRHPAPSRAAR